MKNKLKTKLQPKIVSAILGLAVLTLGSTDSALAQTVDKIISTFDTATGTGTDNTAGTGIGWGSSTWTWDAVEGTPAGAVLITCNFSSASDTPCRPRFCVNGGNPWYDAGTVAFSQYQNIQFDIKWDNTSDLTIDQFNSPTSWPLTITNAAGELLLNAPIPNATGGMDVMLCGPGGNQGNPFIANIQIPAAASNGWVHITIPINASTPGLDGQSGITFGKWVNNYGGQMTAAIGTGKFWIDNITLGGTAGPPPPPRVSLKKATSGLNVVSSGTGQYDRQQIRTVDSNFNWVGATEPVTYEFTIKEGPGLGHNGFQAHIFLVPNSTDGASSIDWNVTNLVWLNIQGNGPNGGSQVTFMYKTNRPAGNDMLFNQDPAATNASGALIGVGNLGQILSTNILGTYKLTFSQDTNITVVVPDGTTTNYTITADAAALFGGTMQAFFGGQPNDLANLGLGYVFSKIKISTPTTTMIEDDFTGGELDALKWVKQASSPPGVYVVPTNSFLALEWTLPASGFFPEIGTSLAPGATWVAPVMGNPATIQTNMRQLLLSSELGNQNFFRMIKRIPSLLQVLMPGETNAPNTITGKVGTMNPVTVGIPVPITIHSVDASFNIANSTHTISLALNPEDPLAFIDPNAALVAGTTNILVQFGTAGTYTITATDVTDGSLTTGVSGSITVTE